MDRARVVAPEMTRSQSVHYTFRTPFFSQLGEKHSPAIYIPVQCFHLRPSEEMLCDRQVQRASVRDCERQLPAAGDAKKHRKRAARDSTSPRRHPERGLAVV